MPHVIAVSNQKGGVGKTTTAVNLAASLAAAGHSTLLVDMDPQSNATSAVGVDPNNIEASIYDALMDGGDPQVYALGDRFANLSLVPSTVDLAGAEFEMIDLPEREYRLRRCLEQLDHGYDYIVIDSPPSLGLLTINVLVCANWVLIPVQAEYFALEGLSRMMLTLQRIQQRHNTSLQLLGICATMFDGRTNLAQQVLDELRKAFAGKVFSVAINRSVRLSEAPSFGKPIMYYDSRSTGAEQYLRLSEEILHVIQEATSAGPRP